MRIDAFYMHVSKMASEANDVIMLVDSSEDENGTEDESMQVESSEREVPFPTGNMASVYSEGGCAKAVKRKRAKIALDFTRTQWTNHFMAFSDDTKDMCRVKIAAHFLTSGSRGICPVPPPQGSLIYSTYQTDLTLSHLVENFGGGAYVYDAKRQKTPALRPMPTRVTRDVLTHMCDALVYLRSQGITAMGELASDDIYYSGPLMVVDRTEVFDSIDRRALFLHTTGGRFVLKILHSSVHIIPFGAEAQTGRTDMENMLRIMTSLLAGAFPEIQHYTPSELCAERNITFLKSIALRTTTSFLNDVFLAFHEMFDTAHKLDKQDAFVNMLPNLSRALHANLVDDELQTMRDIWRGVRRKTCDLHNKEIEIVKLLPNTTTTTLEDAGRIHLPCERKDVHMAKKQVMKLAADTDQMEKDTPPVWLDMQNSPDAKKVSRDSLVVLGAMRKKLRKYEKMLRDDHPIFRSSELIVAVTDHVLDFLHIAKEEVARLVDRHRIFQTSSQHIFKEPYLKVKAEVETKLKSLDTLESQNHPLLFANPDWKDAQIATKMKDILQVVDEAHRLVVEATHLERDAREGAWQGYQNAQCSNYGRTIWTHPEVDEMYQITGMRQRQETAIFGITIDEDCKPIGVPRESTPAMPSGGPSVCAQKVMRSAALPIGDRVTINGHLYEIIKKVGESTTQDMVYQARALQPWHPKVNEFFTKRQRRCESLLGKAHAHVERDRMYDAYGLLSVADEHLVALKFSVSTKEEMEYDAQTLMILRESYALWEALPPCEHVVRFFDYHVATDGVYTVCEFIDGTDVQHLSVTRTTEEKKRKRKMSSPLPQAVITLMMKDVGRALAHISQYYIVHCDVKPKNIMFRMVRTPGGGPRVPVSAVLIDMEGLRLEERNHLDVGGPIAHLGMSKFTSLRPSSRLIDTHAFATSLFMSILGNYKEMLGQFVSPWQNINREKEVLDLLKHTTSTTFLENVLKPLRTLIGLHGEYLYGEQTRSTDRRQGCLGALRAAHLLKTEKRQWDGHALTEVISIFCKATYWAIARSGAAQADDFDYTRALSLVREKVNLCDFILSPDQSHLNFYVGILKELEHKRDAKLKQLQNLQGVVNPDNWTPPTERSRYFAHRYAELRAGNIMHTLWTAADATTAKQRVDGTDALVEQYESEIKNLDVIRNNFLQKRI